MGDTEFGWSPLQNTDGKTVFTMWGHKGEGKTTLSFGAPGDGTKQVLSFDRKAIRVRRSERFRDREDIVVHDAVQYMDYEETKYLESADTTVQYTFYLLRKMTQEKDVDWVIFDGAETFVKLTELRMRHKHQLKLTQGADRSLWNFRNLDLKLAHDLAMQAAKRGVIYTVQSTKDEIVVDGTLIRSMDSPRWTDVIMTETDVVVQVKSDSKAGTFLAMVTTSKDDQYSTGGVLDVTRRSFWDVATSKERCPRCGSTKVTKGPVVQCLRYPDCKFVEKAPA